MISFIYRPHVEAIKSSFRRLMQHSPESWDEILTDSEYQPLLKKYPQLRSGPFYGFPISKIASERVVDMTLTPDHPQELKTLFERLSTFEGSHPLRKDKEFIENLRLLIKMYFTLHDLAPFNEQYPVREFATYSVPARFFADIQRCHPDLLDQKIWIERDRIFNLEISTSEAITRQDTAMNWLRSRVERKRISLEETVATITALSGIKNPEAVTAVAKFSIREFEKLGDYSSAVRVKKKLGESSLALRDYAFQHGLSDLAYQLHKEVLAGIISRGNVEETLANRNFGGQYFRAFIIQELDNSDNPQFAYKVATRLCGVNKTRLVKYGRAAAVPDRELAKILGFKSDIEPLIMASNNVGLPDPEDRRSSISWFAKDLSGRGLSKESYVARCEQFGEQAFGLGLINQAVLWYRSACKVSFGSRIDTIRQERLEYFESTQEDYLISVIQKLNELYPGKSEPEIASIVSFIPSIKPFLPANSSVTIRTTNLYGHYATEFTIDSSIGEISQAYYVVRCEQFGEEALDHGLLNTAINWYYSAVKVTPDSGLDYEMLNDRLQRLQRLQKRFFST